MKRFFCITGLVVLALLASSRPAHAGIIDVLEQLSGPGPFGTKVPGLLIDGGCGGRNVPLGIPVSAPPPTRPCFYFDARPFFHADANQFYPSVDADAYEFGLTFPVRLPIELGFGAGLIRFNSNGVTTTKATTTPVRVVVKPLFIVPQLRDNKWAGLVKYYVRETIIWGRLTQDDFGVSATRHVFNEKNERVTSAGFLIDAGELLDLVF